MSTYPRHRFQKITDYPGCPQTLLSSQLGPLPLESSRALSAGVLGLIIVGTGTMGANLHKVNRGEMALPEAVGDSAVKGAAGGFAAATATALSTSLTSGGIAGLAVTLAAATGVSYALANGFCKAKQCGTAQE